MLDFFKDWLGIVSAAVSLATLTYVWLTSQAKDNSEKLETFNGEIQSVKERVAKIEGDLEHLPDKDSQHRLELALSELSGDIKTMAAEQTATRNTVRRMEEIMMKGAKA